MDINSIDWNLVWKEQRQKNAKKDRDPEYWNKRAPSFANHVITSGYSAAFIKIMKPKSSWTVLDMACGSGTLAIPLASKVKEVTGVDFSDGMLKLLKKEAGKRKIKNIKTINASWDDNWDEKKIGVYDIAIASRSLAMDDIRGAILKLMRSSRKRIYLSTVSGEGPYDRRILEAAGRNYSPPVDYIYLYNLLFQMGIRANVDFISEPGTRFFDDHEAASDSVRWMIDSMNEQEEILLKEFLNEHLVRHKGKWMFDYEKKNQWAVIWWEK